MELHPASGLPALGELFAAHDDVLTLAVLRSHLTPGTIRGMERRNEIHRLWHGVYTSSLPTTQSRIRGLGVSLGTPVTACMGTGAALFGFDTENTRTLHVVDPGERHIRSRSGVAIHQRLGAPTMIIDGLSVTKPAWTAVEVARTLPPNRALATLDLALTTRLVTTDDLERAELAQATRAGIIEVRRLIPLADGASGSPMESETRLVLHDGGVPRPCLQWPVLDEYGQVKFLLDFAWPEAMLALEYDGDEFHSTPLDVRRDKMRTSWLLDRGWLVIAIVADDVRRHPADLCHRVQRQLALRANRSTRQ